MAYSHKQFMGDRQTKPGDLLQGTLDLLVMKTLARGPMHGYSIVEFIHETSEDVLRVEEGALYPALHRLELRGLLASEWGVSDNFPQSSREILPAYCSREETVSCGNRALGPHVDGHPPDSGDGVRRIYAMAHIILVAAKSAGAPPQI